MLKEDCLSAAIPKDQVQAFQEVLFFCHKITSCRFLIDYLIDSAAFSLISFFFFKELTDGIQFFSLLNDSDFSDVFFDTNLSPNRFPSVEFLNFFY